MKKVILSVLLILISTTTTFAYSFREANATYANNARAYAKYYPQTAYNRRYARSQSNYIYSPQQARYYGYRVPQQSTINESSYSSRYYSRRY